MLQNGNFNSTTLYVYYKQNQISHHKKITATDFVYSYTTKNKFIYAKNCGTLCSAHGRSIKKF